MKVVFFALLLQASVESPGPAPVQSETPRYPLTLGGSREMNAVTGARLTDLSYSLMDALDAAHAFGAAVQFGTRAVARVRFDGEDREATYENARLTANFGSLQGAYRGAAAFTASSTRVAATFLRHRSDSGGGANLTATIARNVTDRFDFEFRASGETRNVRFPDENRAILSGGATLSYQYEASFDAAISGDWRKVHTPGGLEFSQAEWNAQAGGVVGASQLAAGASYLGQHGKLAHRDVTGSLSGAFPLVPRVLFRGDGFFRHEIGGGIREHRSAASFTWFSRLVRLSRRGAAAGKAVELARAMRESGYFERARFDELDASHRELRRREALRSGNDARLSAMSEELHAAEIEDRTVPLFGVSFVEGTVSANGLKSRTFGLTAGIPWPAGRGFSFRSNEEAVPFVRLDASRRRDEYGASLVSFTDTIELTLELNRELAFTSSWSQVDGTPLERLRRIGEYRIFTAAMRYLYSR